MLVLVTYDVNTTNADGKRRLRNVAKKCVARGQRVQNSVFECLLDETQYRILKAELTQIIDEKSDSLRFYELGNKYQNKVEHIGAKRSYSPEEVLMI
ncbi:MAG: CRISPR-associated endonuclease Cas2 [Clostridia bacterium]|nr:CRISPR-associated endonuclease Cas2 [Clostridia bacterium]